MSYPAFMSAFGLQGLRLPVGVSASIAFTIVQGGTQTAVAFPVGSTLTVKVWKGGDLAAAVTPTAAFVSEAAGTCTLTITGASTASVTPGMYRLLITVTVSGTSYSAHDGVVIFDPAPGLSTEGSVYCQYTDMQAVFSGLDQLQDQFSDKTGFLAERIDARNWFNMRVWQRYSPRPDFNRRRGTTLDPIYGFDVPEPTTTPPTPSELRTLLAGSGLIATGSDSAEVARINAYFAVGKVLRRVPGTDARAATYRQFASDFMADAERDLDAYSVYIDTNSDSTADILIKEHVIFLT